MKEIKKATILTLKAIVCMIALYILVVDLDIRNMWELVKNLNTCYMMMSALSMVAIFVLSAYKWGLILPAVKYGKRLRGVMISHTISYSIGGQLMGEAGRVLLTDRNEVPKSLVMASVIVDKLLGLVGVMITCLVGTLLTSMLIENKIVKLMGVICITGIIIILIVCDSRLLTLIRERLNIRAKDDELGFGLGMKIHCFLDNIKICTTSRKNLIFNVFCSILMQVLSVNVMNMIFRAMGEKVSFPYQCAMAGVTSVVGFIPFSLFGIGVTQITEKGMLELYGISGDIASAEIAIKYALLMCFAFLFGVIILFGGCHKKREK